MSFPQVSTVKFDYDYQIQNSPISNENVSPKQSRKSISIKRQWTSEEDRKLVEWVKHNGTKKWSYIAEMFEGRTGKQCRERWHNFLCPDIKKESWSEEEYQILIQAHKVFGKKWSKIAQRLPGRTDCVIKNLWNTTKRRVHTKRNKRSYESAFLPSSCNTLENYLWSIREDENLPMTSKAVDAIADDDQKAPEFNNNNKYKRVQRYELSDDNDNDEGEGEDEVEDADADGKCNIDLNSPTPLVDASSTSVYIPTEPSEYFSFTPWSGDDIKQNYEVIDEMWAKIYGDDFTF